MFGDEPVAVGIHPGKLVPDTAAHHAPCVIQLALVPGGSCFQDREGKPSHAVHITSNERSPVLKAEMCLAGAEQSRRKIANEPDRERIPPLQRERERAPNVMALAATTTFCSRRCCCCLPTVVSSFYCCVT